MICDFQHCDSLTTLDSGEPVQPPFKLRNSKSQCQWLKSHRILKRQARALIRLRVCTGWSESLLVAQATLLEISCCGSYVYYLPHDIPDKVTCNIKNHHECEGGKEKYVLRITVWHYEACRVMTNGDPEGWIFLSHPHTNNGFFFLLTTKHLILYWKNMTKTSRKS